MVRTALIAGAAAAPVAFAAGALAGGTAAGVSAALGVGVVVANFAAHGISLAWASTVSVVVVQATALVGFVVRMGVVTGILFALDATSWFSPLVFGLSVMAATIALLAYETRLLKAAAALQIPADSVAARAKGSLRAREAAR